MIFPDDILTGDPTRLALTAAGFAAYGATCLLPWLRHRRKRAAGAATGVDSWIVAHASQTGNAAELAEQTAATLRLAGIGVRVCELSDVTQSMLEHTERILFVVSTYGEGDAPDAGAAFAGRLMTRTVALPHLHYAVLALGDRAYSHFCRFGRALDEWLRAQGAQPLFDRIDVDRSSAQAIGQWRQQLSHLAGTSDAPDWGAPAFAPWRIAARRLLNPHSAGGAVWHIELEPAEGTLPSWQSGDLVQVVAPGDPEHPREYSIASIPADGRVHLLVRLHRHADGSSGVASGWLCEQADIGTTIALRLRQHRRFRLENNAARPLILIGNGSGIAGLRGHLRARVRAGQGRNWLLFGERNAVHDMHYGTELHALYETGMLERLDLAFSRDQPERLYVQDVLRRQAPALVEWVRQDAAIYVCGSLGGMAGGVDAALRDILGAEGVDALALQGRYRRDVY
ncbi:sulfite reductase subunit alpha [Pseudoduganella plicata]|uniref:NADPH--hemoprotein reductase n=1 Tax=Pseudoduganella plicata TaxID=321984 RepID=A0A4P7BCA6_9BURK|nr:sulfite reductase subunit alpha [Pseudoduganella plicata]QBQ36276.1 oxidoreductase [Pseudoduganella plicata]GGY76420.1 oxidoreductase [Pseudoduganella plicata]